MEFRGPLRIFEQRDGFVEAGELVAVLSRAGVGKSALLVSIGLDLMAAGRNVLHVTTGGSVADVEEGYRQAPSLDAAAQSRQGRRWIQSYPDDRDFATRMVAALELVSQHAAFSPDAILVDDFALDGPDEAKRAELVALRESAKAHGASLWVAVRTHRSRTGAHPTELPPACEGHEDLIDVALFLEPQGDRIDLRVLCDRCGEGSAVLPLEAEGLWPRDPGATQAQKPVLLSGGAEGAEETFGRCAEQWGLEEVTYSFPGQTVARRRGLVELTEAELARGDVSAVYLSSKMNREYHADERLRKVIQALWYEVSYADEVFVVGSIEPDGTVRGGTGWAAELARHWNKPVFVFDGERGGWSTWRDNEWTAVEAPRVTGRRFAGSGTRHLDDAGRAAIEGLFARSFGER